MSPSAQVTRWSRLALGLASAGLLGVSSAAQSPSNTVLLSETFTGSLGSLTPSVLCASPPGNGAWEHQAICAPVIDTARFGEGSDCGRYADTQVTAALETPSLSLDSCLSNPALRFRYLIDYQETSRFDRAWVDAVEMGSPTVLADNGDVDLTGCSTPLPGGGGLVDDGEFHQIGLDLTPFLGGDPLQFRFVGQTSDGASNLGRGFLVDDVEVRCSRPREAFQVNTFTTSHQSDPAVAVAEDRSFLIGWTGFLPLPQQGEIVVPTYTVRTRLFSAEGLPQGDEQVLAAPGHIDSNPVVAALSSGEFLVAWEDDGILGQRVSAAGLPVGDQLTLSEATSAERPSLAPQPDSFVVTWITPPNGYSRRRLTNDGTPLEPDTPTVGREIAALDDGSFLIAFEDLEEIYVQLHDPDGVPVGGPVQVSDSGSSDDDLVPGVVALSDGFFVLWGQRSPHTLPFPRPYTPLKALRGRRLASDGTPIGAPFEVASSIETEEHHVARTTADELVVVWGGIWARLLGPDGTHLTDPFRVAPSANAFDTLVGWRRSLWAAGPINGSVVVTWGGESGGTDVDEHSIQARIVGSELFSDGFESGDTRAWVGALGGGSPSPQLDRSLSPLPVQSGRALPLPRE